MAGDYRSRNFGTNNWSDPSQWERYNGAAWIANPAEGYPGQTAVSGTVSIRALRSIVLDVTPANNIGTLSVAAIAALTTSGNPSISVNGNLGIGIAGSVTFGGTGNMFIGGSTSLSNAGSLTDNNGAGITTFTGGVTLNPGANWTSTAVTAAGNLIFKGGIANGSATFSAGGATFNTNPQAISGTLSFANVVTVTGIAVTNNGTVTMSGTGAGVLNGTGTWIQGAGSVLNYAGSSITTSAFTATAANNTITYNSSVPQTIPGVTYQNLVLNNSSGTFPQITLAADLTVSNALTMTSGVVDLAGNTLTLGTAGVASTLTRTASTTTNWMYGGVFSRHWLNATPITSNSGNNYGLFPMGESTASSYSPLEINSTASPTSNGVFSVAYAPDPFNGTDLSPFYNDGGVDVEHILNSGFITAVSGVTGGTYDIDVTMTGVNPAGVLSDMRLVVSTGGTTASAVGTHAAATGTVSNPTAKRTGLTIADLTARDFRLGTINQGATPLPVEFLALNADAEGSHVNVVWSTALEFNTNYFIVQRSKDGSSFESLSQVAAAGNSSTVKNYQFVDQDPYSGVSYYRLKQVDVDGKFAFSHIVSVNRDAEEMISVYPNPSSGPFSLSLSGEKGNQVLIVVRDVLGKEHYSQMIVMENEKEIIAFDLAGKLAPGVYVIVVRSSGTVIKKKLVIK